MKLLASTKLYKQEDAKEITAMYKLAMVFEAAQEESTLRITNLFELATLKQLKDESLTQWSTPKRLRD